MTALLFYFYQGCGLLFYGYLSLVLFARLLVKRWLWFSVGFFLFYGIGGHVFFGEWPFPFHLPLRTHLMHQLISLVPAVAFVVGSPIIFGWCLVRGMSLGQTIGVLIVYCSLIFLSMIGGAVFDWWPAGIAHLVPPIIRYWLEAASVFVLVFGIPAVIGYGLMRSMEARKISGMVVMFLVSLAPFFSVIYLMTGFEYVHRFMALNPGLFS